MRPDLKEDAWICRPTRGFRAAAAALKAEGKVKSLGRTEARSMAAKWARAERGRPFWAEPEMRAVQVTTEGSGSRDRRVAAAVGRSSLEYMLTRWLERNAGSGLGERCLTAVAWAARPRRAERMATASSTAAARDSGSGEGSMWR